MHKPVLLTVWVSVCICASVVFPLANAGEADYVGIEKCKICHEEIYKKWEITAHKKAFERIEVKDQEKNPDCLKCHVTGYDVGGFKLGAANAAKFVDVQCEACHGPGSQHIKMVSAGQEKSHEKGLGLIEAPVEKTCKKCHPDVIHFKKFIFKEYVKKINHK